MVSSKMGAVMKQGFRQCMAWLHTWTGLVVGWVLFFVFLTGTAGYVQVELTRWMQPERPLQSSMIPNTSEQLNKAYHYLKMNSEAQTAERWGINFLVNERGRDELNVNWSQPAKQDQRYGEYKQETLDANTGLALAQTIKPRETGGGDSLYRMHYALHYIPYDWAIRIVGICTMFMFVAIISGVITHKKIFKDFFTFRPAKGQRSWLDAHAVISVIALPFYIMITYSGLIFFANAYMPLGVPMVYGFGEKKVDRFYEELYQDSGFSPSFENTKIMTLGQSATNFVNVQPLLKQAQQQWGKDSINSVNFYPQKGNTPPKLEFYKINNDSVVRQRTSMDFDLFTGKILSKDLNNQEKAPLKFANTMLGLHEGLFASPLMRIFYVITGLLGTAMIATGLVLWTVKRRPKQIKAGQMSFGHALVERLNIAVIAGLPLAIATYFWANRFIDSGFSGRAAWEVHTLYITLLVSFIYSLFRPIAKAWFELLIIAALAYLFLPILNLFTTERHLGITLRQADYALASIDIGFFIIGLVLAWSAYRVWIKRNAILKPIIKTAKKTIKTSKTLSSKDSVKDIL